MRELAEPFAGFNYDYRMKCECGEAVLVSAATYFREQSVNARVPCGHCPRSVHFGPAVALLRNGDDPALDNQIVNESAWYHTSTWPDWPSADHRARTTDEFRAVPNGTYHDIDGAIDRATTRALHVGTYEAAIENMFRRMRNQGDAISQFHLHRVSLDIDPRRINEGYRDENTEEAAQLGIADLDQDDLDAIRYLNVREATGSLSLAIRPECIATIQRLAIPVTDLAAPPSADLQGRLDAMGDELDDLSKRATRLPDISARQRWQAGKDTESTEYKLLQRTNEIEERQRDLWNEVTTRLADHYLAGVSPVVIDDYTSAIHAWRQRSGTEAVPSFVDRCSAMAALLTHGTEVVRLISAAPLS